MSNTIKFKHFSLLWVLMNFCPAYSQNKIDFRDYFFPQNQQEYTLKYGNVTDTTTFRIKTIKVLGQDTLEVSDYGKNGEFYRSLIFVISEDHINVLKGKKSINSKVFDSEIELARWAQTNPGKANKIHFSSRTRDTCTSPPPNCYWEWFRQRQTGLKKGAINWKGKLIKTVTISFDETVLFQPILFSSISGMTTRTISYVFAEGVGIVKISSTSKKPSFSVTLKLLN